MNLRDINASRFARSLEDALDTLATAARCYGYSDDPDYLEVKTFLENKLRIRTYDTGPGWWKMFDEELKKFYDIDPDLTDVTVKEKFGHARIDYASSVPDQLTEQELHLREVSSHICETCGNPGKLRKEKRWMQTLCDTCFTDSDARLDAHYDTIDDYFASTDWAVQSLGTLPLTERDKVYLRYAAHHPDEMDKIVDQIIQSHRAT